MSQNTSSLDALFGAVSARSDGSEVMAALKSAARERILVLDGAMGTQIQGLGFNEDHFRGDRFGSCACHQQGNNDLLILTQPKAIEEIHYRYAKAGADVKLYPTQDEAMADLTNGRLDAVVSDKFVLVDWLKTTGNDCCKLVGDLKNTESLTGIAVRKGDPLREKLNAAIDAIVKDGTYAKINAKYFDFDIYGKD